MDRVERSESPATIATDTRLLRRALRHLYGCPYEPYVCTDKDHALATDLMAEMAAGR
jgi:hypothetical protein